MRCGALHAQIERRRAAQQRELALRYPNYAYTFEPLRWQPQLATPSDWDVSSLRDPASFDDDFANPRANDFERLFAGFCNPPYPMRWQDGLFADLCSAVGLQPDEDVQVLDWVGGPWCEPRAQWSSYFDAGLEWWGVWCLTIHNPQRQTLSLLAASATD